MRKTPYVGLIGLVATLVVACGESAEIKASTGSTETATLAVENMTCVTCPIAVRKALEGVDGVVEAKVDFDTKTAVVTYDPARADAAALTRATADAGYPSQVEAYGTGSQAGKTERTR